MTIALCGLGATIMLVTMMLGTLFPLMTFLCPAIAGLLLIPFIRECGATYAFLLYLAVSVLSLMLVPDKEAALLFALLLGPYPLLRLYLNRIKKQPIQIMAKLLCCNILVSLVYALLLFVFAPAAFSAELADYTTATLLILLFMGNLVFLLYDLCLSRISFYYEYKLRDKLFRYQSH